MLTVTERKMVEAWCDTKGRAILQGWKNLAKPSDGWEGELLLAFVEHCGGGCGCCSKPDKKFAKVFGPYMDIEDTEEFDEAVIDIIRKKLELV